MERLLGSRLATTATRSQRRRSKISNLKLFDKYASAKERSGPFPAFERKGTSIQVLGMWLLAAHEWGCGRVWCDQPSSRSSGTRIRTPSILQARAVRPPLPDKVLGGGWIVYGWRGKRKRTIACCWRLRVQTTGLLQAPRPLVQRLAAAEA